MNSAQVVLILIGLVILVVGWPIALIWAVNTLFATTIVFTVKTWVAAWIITVLAGSSRSRS